MNNFVFLGNFRLICSLFFFLFFSNTFCFRISPKDSLAGSLFTRENCEYTANYCEENVYLLCTGFSQLNRSNNESAYAVFLTNPERNTYIRYQKNSTKPKSLVKWDYHVVFIHKTKTRSFVYDLDSKFDFPVGFKTYYKKALKFKLPEKPETFYRVTECGSFSKEFATDRSHLITNGTYYHKPPKYPNIVNERNESMNLHKYLDVSLKDKRFGVWMKEKTFYSFFTK